MSPVESVPANETLSGISPFVCVGVMTACNWAGGGVSETMVNGNEGEGGLSSSGCSYTVELKDKKWVVTKRLMNWIS